MKLSRFYHQASHLFHNISKLNCIEPIGIGTPYAEACSCFSSRLSETHSITLGMLLTYELAPAMGNEKLAAMLLRGSSRVYERHMLFNGHSQTTLAIATALEALTCRSDIIYCTLLPWREVIDFKGLLRTHRAWCPKCLQEWKEREMTIYEPLLWYISTVKICPIHQCHLSSVCQRCMYALPVITRITRPGYCSACGAWLGSFADSPETGNSSCNDYEKWATDNIKSLIAIAPSLSFFPLRHSLIEAISKYINEYFKGSPSVFAQKFHISLASVNRWRRRQVLPSFYNLLQISYLTKTNLVEFLIRGILNPITDSHLPEDSLKYHSAGNRKLVDHERVKQALQKIFASPDARPTITQVSKKLGYTKKTLYRHFPDLCRSIAEKSARHRKSLSEGRLKQESLFVQNLAEQLWLDGIYPGYIQIETLASKNGILRGKEVRNVWRNSLRKLGLRK